jgi:hypothetical protein
MRYNEYSMEEVQVRGTICSFLHGQILAHTKIKVLT